MIERQVSPEPGAFEQMASLTLDTALFRSEFHLCDRVSEYLADIVAQSHEDPARYANFSSQLINEMIEFSFRSAVPTGQIDFRLLKNEERVRVSIEFAPVSDHRPDWLANDTSAIANGHPAVGDLWGLANAIRVNLHTEEHKENHVTLMADFALLEAVR